MRESAPPMSSAVGESPYPPEHYDGAVCYTFYFSHPVTEREIDETLAALKRDLQGVTQKEFTDGCAPH